MHKFGLEKMLKKCGATVPNCIVFSHPSPEPWRTIGVFLKIAGKAPERAPFLSKFYKRYGHSREQHDEAAKFGTIIAQTLKQGKSIADIDFHTKKAIFSGK